MDTISDGKSRSKNKNNNNSDNKVLIKGKLKKNFRPGSSNQNVKMNVKWSFIITFFTFLISIAMSATSSSIMEKVSVSIAFVVLFIVIFIGVFFDMIGTAVATATETSFHSLASRRVKGAKESINIIRLAPQVSNFCNDVIGDVAGIVSGASVGVIVVELVSSFALNGVITSLAMTGMVAAMTVGAKSFAKGVSMIKSNEIVFSVGKIFYYTKYIFSFKFLKSKQKK